MSIRAVFEHGQLRLLDQVDLKDGEQVDVIIQRKMKKHHAGERMTALDLMRLPLEERERILAEAAIQAAPIYGRESDLTV